MEGRPPLRGDSTRREPPDTAAVARPLDVAAPAAPSFDEVFMAEHEVMLRLAHLLVDSREQAEDAVQDAFARLLDRYDTVTNPGAFLRTCVVNRCRDLGRRRTVERRVLRVLRPRAVDPAAGTDHLTDVLAGLSRPRREVVVLRYWGGHTLAEIADLLDVPEGTVRSRLHRAHAELKEVLS
ncbi:MAG: sigma-70 family RNA polymerase sigma factor [Actinomycetota bacterium]|nr:sigma-70 family RNA polymerase sigma factor [Actinomycetota bacterium]